MISDSHDVSSAMLAWQPWVMACQHQWQVVAKRRFWADCSTGGAYSYEGGYCSRVERCWLCGEQREVAE